MALDLIGGEPYSDWLIEGFNAAIHDANLVDIELSGHQFTWERGQDTEGWMECRLDRALTTENWLNLFPMVKLYNLKGAPSDHSAILLVPRVLKHNARTYRFKFENAWTTEPMCETLVREGWTCVQGNNIQEKIKMCSDKLASWGKEITENFIGRI
ncbi:uncharacterized protein LOC141718875 [Apium graveolens]|uniref:uncharacterized protein LOC141718875 n=1 Tax=Apium graveolens TaxID=4045 RepID=UPI003D7AF679